ncbi:MAG: tetratricopeptide repeat protein [Acidobacteriia bacterium]|nr:tetratricopeptide repeat protein [Terriglobia bacterium]
MDVHLRCVAEVRRGSVSAKVRVRANKRTSGVRKSRVGLWFLVVLALLKPLAARAAQQATCHDQPAVRMLIQRGNDLNNPYEERRAALEQAITLCPVDPSLYDVLSVLLLKHHEFDPALHWIHRGLRTAPTSTELRFDLSVALLAVGRAEEALKALKQLPKGPKTEFYTGMTYRTLGDHKAARQALAKAFELGYEDPYVLYALIEQDRALGDEEDGLKDFQMLDQRFPGSPYLHLVLGDAYVAKHKTNEAEREYRQASKLNPNLPLVHFKLGYVQFTSGRNAEAVELFRKEILLNPDFPESYLYLGASLRMLGRGKEALPVLEQAIMHDPNSLLAYRVLVATEVEENRPDSALRVLKTAVKRFPNEGSFHAQLATLLTKLGRVGEAKREAEVARRSSTQEARHDEATLEGVELVHANQRPGEKAAEPTASTPTSSAGHEETAGTESRNIVQTTGSAPLPGIRSAVNPTLARARQCLNQADAVCAEAALNEIHDQELQQSREFLDLMARILTLERKYPEALGTVKSAIQKDPTDVQWLLLEGELYQRMGDQVSAIHSFLRCQQLEPRSPVPLYLIGMSFFTLAYYNSDDKYYDRAVRHFTLAVQLDPKYSKAQFMLGVVKVVRFALPEAKAYFEVAIESSPENPFYHLHYGVLLGRLGEYPTAFREIQLAEKLNPDYALTHFNLGNLYARQERFSEAKTELETAVRLNPRLAGAFYSLGGVYHHLGLDEMSKKAYENFQTFKEQEKVQDAVEATISSPGALVDSQHP